MDFIELGLLFSSFVVTINIIFHNHSIIKKLRHDTGNFFIAMKQEEKKLVATTAIKLKLDELDSKLHVFNSTLMNVVFLAVIGEFIFYFYLEGLAFAVLSFFTFLVVLSFSIIKSHLKTSQLLLKDLYEFHNKGKKVETKL